MSYLLLNPEFQIRTFINQLAAKEEPLCRFHGTHGTHGANIHIKPTII